MATAKVEKRAKIKRRVRKKVYGTPEVPRLTVFRSNKEISAQVIDDDNGLTLASASSKKSNAKGAKADIATEVGKELAAAASKAGVTTVVFDRNGYQYHGRVKALADGAREGGLKF